MRDERRETGDEGNEGETGEKRERDKGETGEQPWRDGIPSIHPAVVSVLSISLKCRFRQSQAKK